MYYWYYHHGKWKLQPVLCSEVPLLEVPLLEEPAYCSHLCAGVCVASSLVLLSVHREAPNIRDAETSTQKKEGLRDDETRMCGLISYRVVLGSVNLVLEPGKIEVSWK